MYSLNTSRESHGIVISDPNTNKQVYLIRYQDAGETRPSWALTRNDYTVIANFHSLEAAEYRELSDFIERKANQ